MFLLYVFISMLYVLCLVHISIVVWLYKAHHATPVKGFPVTDGTLDIILTITEYDLHTTYLCIVSYFVRLIVQYHFSA